MLWGCCSTRVDWAQGKQLPFLRWDGGRERGGGGVALCVNMCATDGLEL